MNGRRAQGGFTYLGLIVLVMVIGMVGAATLKIGALMQRTAAENELLETGAAFSEALRSYAAATPQGQPQQPPTLQELLKDPRFPGVRRHLRKIFIDPMTGKAEWGIVYLGDKKGVIGVYSLSTAKPFKVGNFDARFVNFENKQKISEWRFTAGGQGLVAPGAAPLLATPSPGSKELPAPLIPGQMPPPAPVAEPPPPAQPPAEPEPEVPAEPPAAPEPEEKAESKPAEPKPEEPKP
jgi:type II secretory pathway pseudopilin PulG